MTWYKKLGFHNNPFSIKPAAFHDELTAYDMSFFYKKINNSELIFVEGDYGSGKTTILKNIISHFRGHNKIIYYNFNTGKKFEAKNLLDGANSLIRRLSGLRVKNIIMLLDEVQEMTVGEAKDILKYYKDGTIQSLVFVSHDYDIVNFPNEFDSYLNGNIITTVPLNDEEAVVFVRQRIGNLDLLPDKLIIKLFRLAGKNSRRLLEYCEDVVRYTVDMNDDEVSDYHITEVLGDIKPEIKDKPTIKQLKPKITGKTKPKLKVRPKAKPQLKEEAEPKIVAKVELREEPQEDMVITDLSTEYEPVVQKVDKKREKKFKRNKLIDSDRTDKLGVIETSEKEKEEEIPEYKLYFLDD